jgi:predicted phosphodiesterase
MSPEPYYNSIAFISDIHANIEALEAVLADIEKQKVSAIYCLGDLVGYGPDPQTCLQKIRMLQSAGKIVRMVPGNHDVGIVKKNLTIFNSVARQANEWTIKALQDTPQWVILQELANEKPVQEVGRFILVHSTLNPEPEKWEYLKIKNAAQNFVERKIVFVGHSHIPTLYSKYTAGKDWNPINLFGNEGHYIMPPIKPEALAPGEASTQYRAKLSSFPSMIANVGSVGQPRDYNPCARYLLHITVDYNDYLEYRQAAYDVQKTVEKLKNRGLDCDKELAIRLATGGRSTFSDGAKPPAWFPF